MECDHPDCIAREDKIKKLKDMVREIKGTIVSMTDSFELIVKSN